ncbi:inositol phospholipid synthesis and fat-storage-inducing TM-domain-containing protein [Armillaria nabsnona]|nr:inositol phospholipid synthesis and fat-storage-inducing TM-domain-containing protein [Armillaria nabsnona]
MADIRISAFVAVTSVVFVATAYSVVYGTYIDTSDPLLSHLPHPLSQSIYWATKSNFLNVYFIKYAWGWTSAAFLFSWATSSPDTRTASRMLKWVTETAAWLVFTSWFFGPALLDRAILASGGDCFVSLPSGETMTVPHDFCFTKSTLTPAESHLFSASFVAPPGWEGKPRLRKGHDISGHIFLLTMSILFLADQLRPSLRHPFTHWPTIHKYAVAANIALIATWLFASATTSAYFHSPLEKVTGYSGSSGRGCSFILTSWLVLGVMTFGLTQIPSLIMANTVRAEKLHSS